MTATHAQYRAAKQKLQEAEAELRQTLPFLSDDAFVLISAELDARMLGRLGCAAQRFWRPSVPDPAHTAEDAGAAELWSVAEEGARRRLVAQGEQVRGWVCRGGVGGSWLRALGEAEKLQRPLRFTAHGKTDRPSVVCRRHEMRRGRHYATFTLRFLPGAGPFLGVVHHNHTGFAWTLTSCGSIYYEGTTCEWEGGAIARDSWKQGDVVVRLPPSSPRSALLTRRVHRACCSTAMRQP